MTVAILIITLIYLYIIGRFVFGFDKIEHYKVGGSEPETTFSIIIPFRNEIEALPELFQSLSELTYPDHLFEIILINDESSDSSEELAKRLISNTPNNVKLINNERKSNAPKKDAITAAIHQSKYNWVITTDADCTFNKNWLDVFNDYILSERPKMVVAPVTYITQKTILHSFQLLDFFSLIGATIGGFGVRRPFLCNGANLAYEKNVFSEVHGYEGNNDIASGDDIFLMEKVLKSFPGQVHYLKSSDVVVSTKPQPTLKKLISQRRRWAAKTSTYSNSFGKLVGSIVLLMNFALLSALFLAALGVFNFKILGYIFLLKFSIDLWLIYKTALFFNQANHLKNYLFSSMLYPFFNVYVALTAWFGGYNWKGRSFSK